MSIQDDTYYLQVIIFCYTSEVVITNKISKRGEIMKSSEAIQGFHALNEERVQLETRLKGINGRMKKLVPEMNLQDAVCFFPGVQAHTVWEKEDLSVVLLENKNRHGNCGILLWGCQFKDKGLLAELAVKIDQFEARFRVFDGQPGSHDLTMLNGTGTDEVEELFKELRRVCSKEGIYSVFVKNAGLLSNATEIFPGREFKDISDFYMLIARSSKELIPEFSFINPENSSAFWGSNG